MDIDKVHKLRRDARERGRERAATRPREPEVAAVTDGDADGTAFRRYTSDIAADPRWVAVFAHGGYFVFGDLDLQDRYCRRLARAIPGDVISVDYGLAPERSATNSVHDAVRCVEYARSSTPGTRIVLCGDSAGGTIAFLAAARLRDARQPVEALFLTNPNLDLTLARFSTQASGGPDLTLLKEAIQAWAGTDPAGSGFSPLNTNLQDMPPTFIAVGALDALRPEAEAMLRTLQDSDVAGRLRIFDGIGHGFMGGQSASEAEAQEETLTTVAALLASLDQPNRR